LYVFVFLFYTRYYVDTWVVSVIPSNNLEALETQFIPLK
jgi:hypothetical protein